MRRGPGGAALPGAQGRGGPGVAPESCPHPSAAGVPLITAQRGVPPGRALPGPQDSYRGFAHRQVERPAGPLSPWR